MSLSVLLTGIFVSLGTAPVSAQFFCCFGAPERSLSQKIAEADVAVVVYCVSISPRHPHLYDRRINFIRRSEEIEAFERQKQEYELEQQRTEPLNFVELLVAGIQELMKPGKGSPDDAIELARDLALTEEDDEQAVLGTTTYEIRWIGRGSAELRPGDKIQFFDERLGEPGKLVLLLGESRLSGIKWTVDVDLTQPCLDYVKAMPPDDAPQADRLSYYFQSLAVNDKALIFDALLELERATDFDLQRFAAGLPRVLLRQRFIQATNPNHVDFYAHLLTYGGDETDGQLIEDKLLAASIGGKFANRQLVRDYLTIVKDKGLDFLDAKFLCNDKYTVEQKGAFLEELSYCSNVSGLSAERFNRSIRASLSQPELARTAIFCLVEQGDWSAVDQVAALYGRPEFDSPESRQAIVYYLMASCLDFSCLKEQKLPLHVWSSLKYLNDLRKRDRRTYKYAHQFLASLSEE